MFVLWAFSLPFDMFISYACDCAHVVVKTRLNGNGILRQNFSLVSPKASRVRFYTVNSVFTTQ